MPTCYICNKKGHVKANCWFNPQNKGNHQKGEHKKGTESNGELKELVMSALAALNLKQNEQGTWYVDSGAATHVTGDTGKLLNPIPYSGGNYIVTGDGSHHSIFHVGNSVIPMSSLFSTFPVLFMPQILKRILFLFPNLLMIIMSLLNSLLLFM